MNRIVTTHAELDQLPFGTVILELDEDEPRAVFCRMLDGTWATFGDSERFHWSEIEVPVEVVLEVGPPEPVSVFVVLEDGWDTTGIVGAYRTQALAKAAIDVAQMVATTTGNEEYRQVRNLYIAEHAVRADLREPL